ncbi:unnamed protein product [Paramecium sonneborni]|uniref:Transmembrane protein n=1 Tax=Paramecium sonneborni TaxID=65129 RepID=A0A8S1RE65_9CILI|nr:unnamed protein product [Paramecium sonneborni]
MNFQIVAQSIKQEINVLNVFVVILIIMRFVINQNVYGIKDVDKKFVNQLLGIQKVIKNAMNIQINVHQIIWAMDVCIFHQDVKQQQQKMVVYQELVNLEVEKQNVNGMEINVQINLVQLLLLIQQVINNVIIIQKVVQLDINVCQELSNQCVLRMNAEQCIIQRFGYPICIWNPNNNTCQAKSCQTASIQNSTGSLNEFNLTQCISYLLYTQFQQ